MNTRRRSTRAFAVAVAVSLLVVPVALAGHVTDGIGVKVTKTTTMWTVGRPTEFRRPEPSGERDERRHQSRRSGHRGGGGK
jgi:hypothetical protein